MAEVTGGCLCGQLRITAIGPPLRVGICHCLECRKHHGSVFYAAANFPASSVQVTGDARAFRGRHFCPDCGSSVFARSEDEVEVHLGTLDAPNQFTPEYELWTCRREAWLSPVRGAAQFDENR